ncbi:hypothetical protein D2962_08780 [Biomaibacter acetigenes]|uniref:Uncharacterized protein n=1 Tax=Biomaibacter acetigenes TaxID=2316383 RepID=A0A3G2R5G1_9FIRM|nr:hypothetical protein D2962_08780 [Biomaibacter acetigenes]
MSEKGGKRHFGLKFELANSNFREYPLKPFLQKGLGEDGFWWGKPLDCSIWKWIEDYSVD